VEEAAARTQARIDSGRQPVIGVNKYRVDTDEEIEVLKVDNHGVRAQQIEKLRRLREERDEQSTQDALEALTRAPGRRKPVGAGRERREGQGHRRRDLRRVGEGVRAARRADPYISGVYRDEAGTGATCPRCWRGSPSSSARRAGGRESWWPRWARTGMTAAEGDRHRVRRPRLRRGCGPLFQTPGEVARQAVEADVHIVGVSSLAAGHLTWCRRCGRSWTRWTGRHHDRGRRRHPAADFAALYEAGAVAIFPPGTVIARPRWACWTSSPSS